MKPLCCILLFLALTSFVSAQNMKPNAKFAEMSDRFVKDSLALSPVSASQAGYHKHTDPATGKTIDLDARLDDVGPQGFAAQERFYSEWRTRFQTETPIASLNPQDAADFRLIDDQIALNLLEFQKIQNYKHNPTVYVELLGNALFLPLTQNYDSKEVRLGDVISRIAQIPRFLDQTKSELTDADPIFISTAVDENDGNLNLLDTVAAEIPAGSPLKAQFDKVAPAARQSLNDFTTWMKNDLAKRPTNGRTWRLGAEWYAPKFRYVMETSITPDQVLADAEAQVKGIRTEMLQVALPLYKQMFPGDDNYASAIDSKTPISEERENRIISAVLKKISDEHPQPDQLIPVISNDLVSIRQFIIDHKIVTLTSRDNLKVIPTPEFMRGIYSVAGFHSAPPLEPTAEAQFWVTPINPKTPEAQVESRLREYNNYTLKWLTMHEALPGHYVQAEHADDVQPLNSPRAAQSFRQRSVRRGLGRVRVRRHDPGRLPRLQSQVQAGAIEDSAARRRQCHPRRAHADHEHDRSAGARPDDEAVLPDAGRGRRQAAPRQAQLDTAADLLRRHSPVVAAAQEIPGRHGQQVHARGVPRPRARSRSAAARVSGEDHFA